MRDASAEVLTGATEMKPAKRMHRIKPLLIVFKIILTIALLSYVLYKFNFKEFEYELKHMSLPLIGAGILLGVLFNIIKFVKWHYLLRSRGVEATFMDAFISYAVGNTVGVITPGRAGELARTLYFPESKRKPVWGLVVYDRVLDVGAMFILGIPGAFIVTGAPLFGIFVITMSIVLIVLGFHSGFLSWTWRRLKRLLGRSEGMGELKDMVTHTQAAWAFVLSLIAFGLVLVQMYVFIQAFQHVNFTDVAMVMPLVILSNLIPITHLGLGVRERVAQMTFSAYGVAQSISAFCAFLIFVINTLLLALVGVFYIGRIRLGRNGEKETGVASLSDQSATPLDS